MKNTIKMSLAAAVAVSAFSTSAFAGNLEEMIKGVDVSGYVDYRLENKSADDKAGQKVSQNWNEYSINVTATSKVNDIVSATVSMGFDEAITSNTATESNPAFATANKLPTTVAAADDTVGLSVDQAYFTFAMGNTTVMAGKQNIPSVFVDQTDTIKQGTGIVALHKISDAITIAGAHFMNNNIGVEDTKTSEVIAMGTVGPVHYSVNYNMTDVAGVTNGAPATESDRYSIAVGATLGPVKVDVRHSAASTDDRIVAGVVTRYEDAEVTKVNVGGTVAGIKLGAMYAMTSDQNTAVGTMTDVAIDGDNDAQVHAKVWQLSTLGLNDGDLFAISADIPVMDKVTLGLNYGFANDGVNGQDRDKDEYLVRLTYKMSKNFTIHGRYSILDTESTTAGVKTESSVDYSRIQLKYTF